MGIFLIMCPINNKEIIFFLMDKFHKCTWDNELGRKKKYYIRVFNFTHNHQQKVLVGGKSIYYLLFWKSGNRKTFHFKCEAFEDNTESYADILASSSWDNLFKEGFVQKLGGAFIVNLHRKMVKDNNMMNT